ncbi:biotin-dependent carboxyltransferase family protein [Rhodobacter sp. NSM]|uniref:biotin-dependent carboxyltransferase family protein n=1 Tax=Rhodobacter sp. NSM TaxID=3457501 RepID=UPI003FD58B4F
MTALLRVVEAGPLSSLQDAGRPGLMRYGVPRSGPMDGEALSLANAALGNPPDATALEVSSGGLVLDCVEGALSVALVGEGFHAACGGIRHEANVVLSLLPGERLAIRSSGGSWAVLALAGRIEVAEWLGSRSTHALSGLGGGLLRAGQEIRLSEATLRPERHGVLDPLPRPTGLLRVTLGPQERFFSAETLSRFLDEPFRISSARDRMGQRLDGPPLPVRALDMPSEAVLRGSVQVSGDGVATVLMADHQTTGGYPRIATVIGPDLDTLARMRPGDAVRFAAVSPAEATGITRAVHEARMERLARSAAPRDLSARLAGANLIGGVVDARD